MDNTDLDYVDPSDPLAQARSNYSSLLSQALRRKRTADTDAALAAKRAARYEGPTVQSGRATLPNVSGILSHGVDQRQLNQAMLTGDSASDDALSVLNNPRFDSRGNPALDLDPDFSRVAKGQRDDRELDAKIANARATGDPRSTVQSVQQGSDGKLYGVMRDGSIRDLGLDAGGTSRLVDLGNGTHAVVDTRGGIIGYVGDQAAALAYERARAAAQAGGKAGAEAGAAATDRGRTAADTLFKLEDVDSLIDAAPVGAGGAAVTGTNRVLGRDSPGNDAQAQLDSLSAGIVAAIIKQYGTNPTDRDVLQAKQAAGDLANPLRTRGERKAALEMLRTFQERMISDAAGVRGDVVDAVEQNTVRAFATEAEAKAANLPRGTRITIGGRPATVL